MHEEYYDVLDEHGNRIGSASWVDVHTKGLLHMTASVILWKDHTRSEFLVHRRSATITYPDLLQHAAGGHIESGDTPEQGAQKEIAEELFSKKNAPHIPLTHITTFLQIDAPTNRELMHVYEGFYQGHFNPNPSEIEGSPYWMRWDDFLMDLATHPQKYTRSCSLVIAEYRKKTER